MQVIDNDFASMLMNIKTNMRDLIIFGKTDLRDIRENFCLETERELYDSARVLK